MARGASRAVSAEGLAPSPDDRQTAEALAQVVEAAGEADVVVMGDARDAAGVAGALAAYLGLPLVAGVRDWIGYTKLDSFVRAGRVRRSPWRTRSTPGISPTSSSGR